MVKKNPKFKKNLFFNPKFFRNIFFQLKKNPLCLNMRTTQFDQSSPVQPNPKKKNLYKSKKS